MLLISLQCNFSISDVSFNLFKLRLLTIYIASKNWIQAVRDRILSDSLAYLLVDLIKGLYLMRQFLRWVHIGKARKRTMNLLGQNFISSWVGPLWARMRWPHALEILIYSWIYPTALVFMTLIEHVKSLLQDVPALRIFIDHIRYLCLHPVDFLSVHFLST